MKILVLSHTGDILGGAEMSMLDVFDVLTQKYGVKAEFIIREPVRGMAGELKKRGWKFTNLPYTFWSDGKPPTTRSAIARNAQMNLVAVEKIEKLIEETKPDIVMTNSIVCPWAAIAAYQQGIPHVWFIREYGDIDHGRIFTIGREKTMADVDTTSDLIITISEALKKHLDKYIEPKKVKVLYNPFKTIAIKKRAQKKVKSPFKYKNSVKFVISGNLAPSKGQLAAINAIGTLSKDGYDVELCVVGRLGEAEFMQQINSVLKEFGIEDRVHLIGFQKDLLAYVRHADIGIMASRMEGFGRVTFEYLLLGKPVIGANSGATPELIVDGSCGYLYELDSPGSLESAMKRYLKKPELISKHTVSAEKRAKEIVGGKYSLENTYKFIEEVIRTAPRKNPTKELYIMNQLKKDARLVKGVRLKSLAYQSAKRVYHKARSIKAKVSGK